MYAPAEHDEVTGLANYVDSQLDAIAAAATGLTEDQARETPLRSGLSIGGIAKHITAIVRTAPGRIRDGAPTEEITADQIAAHEAQFVVGPEETTAGILAELAAARGELREAILASDPDQPTHDAPAPWFGILDARPIRQRFYLVHLIEEIARHAGHADIIREQLDGVQVPSLELRAAGVPANEFIGDYQPAPGTIGA